MLRSKASTYAILAVSEIAKRQSARAGGVQAGEIARCMDLPAAYVAKVLTQLARANVLRSDRGPRGGFRLVNSPDAIALLDVIEAVDGPIVAEAGLIGGHGEIRETLQWLDQVFNDVVSQVRGALRRETIGELMRADKASSSFVPASSTT